MNDRKGREKRQRQEGKNTTHKDITYKLNIHLHFDEMFMFISDVCVSVQNTNK